MKIIFVDDSAIVLNTLKALVQDMIDSKMIECNFINDSTIAKKMIVEESLEYDLMFVDINMPNTNGFELAKMAKSVERYRYKTIIAITSEYSDEAKKRGEISGIDGWFLKSISQDSLQSSILDVIKQLYKS